ncbi:MAG: MalY/PatB family protein [Faecousia sp.]
MKYDFTTIMDRRGMDAIAVDEPPQKPSVAGFDLIPMWVADMNFATVPTVVDSMIRRAQHPAFGYFSLRQEYYDGILRWHKTHHGVELKPEYIRYANGVLGGVVSALNVLCSKGDHVLVHSPTYVGFTHALGDNGYHIVHSPLQQDSQGVWRMDYADMEEKIVQNKIHAAILCSPHNPCGRVWERWELERAMELFKKHDVYVISDEIWSDLILEGYKHIPTQTVSEDAKMRTVAMYAPSKTFNLAGLVGSYSVIYNSWLRDRVTKEAGLSHYNEPNVMSMHALIGAYQDEGYEWLSELRQVLTANVDYACRYIAEHFEGVKVSRPQGTYMLFVDCTDWCAAHGKTIDDVEQAAWAVGVAFQDGRAFHGPCHVRINLALSASRVQEAFRRLDNYVFNV